MDIHNIYRPKDLDELIGQDHIVNSINAFRELPHVYLLAGPKGLGKTSTARILARKVGCISENGNLLEVNSGGIEKVADVREFVESWKYPAYMSDGSSNKFVVIDEAQALSKASWEALNTVLDEPPSHLYVALCTTDPDKVPATIKSRCKSYYFKPVSLDILIDYLGIIAEAEQIKLSEEAIKIIAEVSEGSVRQALSNLDICRTGRIEDLKELLSSPDAPVELIEIIRKLVSNNLKWADFVNFTSSVTFLDSSIEGYRRQIANYVMAVILNPKNVSKVPYLLSVLSTFSKPMYTKVDFTLAMGEILYELEN